MNVIFNLRAKVEREKKEWQNCSKFRTEQTNLIKKSTFFIPLLDEGRLENSLSHLKLENAEKEENIKNFNIKYLQNLKIKSGHEKHKDSLNNEVNEVMKFLKNKLTVKDLLETKNTVVDLDLTQLGLTAVQLKYFVTKLDFKALLRLDLSRNNIRSKGAKLLAVELTSFKSLRNLKLNDNHISDVGALKLIRTCFSLKMIKLLSLKRNNLSPLLGKKYEVKISKFLVY